MESYKENVRSTRTGALGSSDGKFLMQIAKLGYVPKSAYKRMAICKGLREVQEIPHTAAVRAGDEMEMTIFRYIKSIYPLAESNPLVVSQKYARKNFVLLSHPDIRIKDEEKKLLTYIECKASIYTTEKVRNDYAAQLYIHRLLADEEAKSLGKGWKARVLLAHYHTYGLNLDNGIEFDPNRLTLKPTRRLSNLFDIDKSLDIVDDFLETFDEYYEEDEVDGRYLPDNVRTQFEAIANTLREIKEREAKIDEFKQRIYNFFVERNIKSVKCDAFSFTIISPTTQITFDHKRYLEDLYDKHPRIAKKIEEEYRKVSNKKGYVKIGIKNDKDV